MVFVILSGKYRILFAPNNKSHSSVDFMDTNGTGGERNEIIWFFIKNLAAVGS